MPDKTNDRSQEAQRLMQLPALPAIEFFTIVLALPPSTAEHLIASDQGPRMFMLGRRRYIRRDDAMDWIDQRAADVPYVKRRNNRRERAAA